MSTRGAVARHLDLPAEGSLGESLLRPRVGALAGVAVLTLGYTSTLYEVMWLADARSWLFAAVAGGLLAAVVLAGQPERRVLPVAAALGLVGLAWYAHATLSGVGLATLRTGVTDTVALASGISVTRMAATEVWVAVVTLPTVFLSAYLALRRRYVLATVAGGWLGLLLALTGDAVATSGVAVFDTLVCALGATMAVGFGELDRRGGSVAAADGLVLLLAAMAILALFVPVVPAGDAATLSPAGSGAGGSGGDGGDPSALDGQLVQSDDLDPRGPVELSPKVQFVVRADEPRRWRVDVYDQYTGQQWTNRGRDRPYRLATLYRPGDGRVVSQEFEVRQPSSGAMPHAAEPVDVEGVPTDALRARSGVITTRQGLEPGDTYAVESEVPNATADDLREAGDSYPSHVLNTNLGVPNDTPPVVHEIAANVTAHADNDYDRAVAVETFLEREKDYSLNVTRPEGPLAYTFLTQMEAGYCTYFAATMATMLRTQDVPARVAVGYKAGQYVDEETRVVRGSDAHAWVEVFFPGYGWVEFDPTPSSDWARTHAGAVEDARAAGVEGVDVPESENRSVRYDAPSDFGPEESGDDADVGGGASGGNASGPRQQGGVDPSQFPDVEPSDDPLVGPNGTLLEDFEANETENASAPTAERRTRPRRLLAGLEWPLFGAVLLAGALAGARRAGVFVELRRAAGFLWQRRVDPVADAERARERLDRLLARRYEPRRSGETPRAYLDRLPEDVDERVERAYGHYEALRYAGGPDEATADELVALVDELTRESVPVLGRFAA